MTSYLLAQLRDLGGDFPAAKFTVLTSLLGKMGMNPSDRAKIEVPVVSNKKNPYLDL